MLEKIVDKLKKLDPLESGYLLGMVLPAVSLLLVLNGIRLHAAEASLGFFDVLDLVKSEIFLAAGLGLGGLGVLRLAEHRWVRRTAMVLLQLLWLFVLVLEVSGHQFFMATGSPLDFYLIEFSLAHFSNNSKVIGSEVPTWILVLAPTALTWALAMPWVIAWRRSRDASSTSSAPLRARIALPTAVLLLAASALPPFISGGYASGRAATVTVAMTASQALRDSISAAEKVESHALDTHLVAQTERTEKHPRNLVFILLESTRARSVSVYNDQLDTTPFMEQLAEEGTVAEHAYTVVPHSSKALVAILCGFEPRLNMPITEAAPGNIPAKCLPKLLAEQGYSSAFFQAALEYFESRRQLVQNMGFDTFHPVDNMKKAGFAKTNYFGWEDNIMLGPSQKWLTKHRDKPFFATYFTLTPHHNYVVPPRYGKKHYVDVPDVNRYLNDLTYVDHFIKNIFDQYKEIGVFKDTVFVILGDHGEGFGEHGRRQHDNVIYQEGLHIPLIIYDPQAPKKRRLKYAVDQLDLLPTMVNWLGYDITGGSYHGKNMLEVDHERPMRAHCWYERRCMAQIIGDKKFIHHFDSRPDQFFDLSKDPFERHDIASQRDDLDKWRRQLIAWRTRINDIYRTHAEENLGRFLYDDMPEVDHHLDARFGDEIRLRGYDISRTTVHPGQSFKITYYFESLDELPEGWNLFVHGEGSGPFKNLDHVPVGGLYPVHDWQPGQIIADEQEINVPIDWKPGTYDVYLGFWHEDEGRKPITGSIQTDGKRRAKVVSIDVEAP